MMELADFRGDQFMLEIIDYKERANECRAAAFRTADEYFRRDYLKLSILWGALAEYRLQRDEWQNKTGTLPTE
jgi:hypothetical protein